MRRYTKIGALDANESWKPQRLRRRQEAKGVICGHVAETPRRPPRAAARFSRWKTGGAVAVTQ